MAVMWLAVRQPAPGVLTVPAQRRRAAGTIANASAQPLSMLGSTGYRHVVAEWLLQPRAALPVPPSNRGPWPSRRTEVADGLGGCVVVVTRVLPAERTW